MKSTAPAAHPSPIIPTGFTPVILPPAPERKAINTPWSTVGYLTYKRTYARTLTGLDGKPTTETEEFEDTVDRVILSARDQLKVGFTPPEEDRLRDYLLNLKGSPAGRFLWQMGTNTVDRLGLASLQNCAFTIVDHPIIPFTWAMDMLLLGSGVGFNIQRHNVDKIPMVQTSFLAPIREDTDSADHIVPDTREGWVKLLGKVLKSAFFSGEQFTYSTLLIRGKGAPIKGFGGTASGPEDLCLGMRQISDVLLSRSGKKLRPVDCLDIMNIIGSIVVAGNVRRCLPDGSMVHTARGLVPIERVEVGDYVLSYDGQYHKVLNKFDQGEQGLVKISHQDGDFYCTPNHKMAVMDGIRSFGWKRAGDLVAGDRLTFCRFETKGVETALPQWDWARPKFSTTCKDLTIPKLDCDMAWLIGLFHADGYTRPNFKQGGHNAYISLVFGADEGSIARRAKEQLERFGDLHVRLVPRKKEASLMVHCQSKQLAYYMHEHVKQAKQPLVIPDWIFEATPEIRLAYLSGVADGDGSLSNRPVQLVSSVYPLWVNQLQALVSSCGIESRTDHTLEQYKSGGGWQLQSRLNVILSRAKDALNSIPTLDKQVKLGRTSRGNGYPNKWITDPAIRRKCGIVPKNGSKQVSVDNFPDEVLIPVEVIDVTDSGMANTWDIEVEDVHSFICNGLLTHNSAQIAIGDPDDIEYLSAKRWDLGDIPSWRSCSNNSVACDNISDLPDCFWDGYMGQGEPYGLINLKLSRQMGRLGETQYPDPEIEGYNPCLPAFASIWTKRLGEATMGDVEIGDEIWSRQGWTKIINKWSTGVKPVFLVKTENGEFIGTNDHRLDLLTHKEEVGKSNIACELTSPGTDLSLIPDSHPSFDRYHTKDCRVRIAPIVTREPLGEFEVFDITVDNDSHTFWSGGLTISNCAEQGLANFETCCLAEIFLPNIESQSELTDVAVLLYRMNKHSLLLPCHQKETEAIVHKNMRMGIGITGVLQSSEEQVSWLNQTYLALRQFDVEYSALHGINPSIKLSTLKPSGTLSLLPGVVPGIHPGYAQFMIRRIRIASHHPLVETCRSHGYPVEYVRQFDGTEDHSTVVVSFPFSYPVGTKLASDMTAIDQLEQVRKMQTIWSDNSVSCTVYYRKEELPDIQAWLVKNYSTQCKTLSFLLHSDHGFDQAPFEEITEEAYNELLAKTTVINRVAAASEIGLGADECAGGACPIR